MAYNGLMGNASPAPFTNANSWKNPNRQVSGQNMMSGSQFGQGPMAQGFGQAPSQVGRMGQSMGPMPIGQGRLGQGFGQALPIGQGTMFGQAQFGQGRMGQGFGQAPSQVGRMGQSMGPMPPQNPYSLGNQGSPMFGRQPMQRPTQQMPQMPTQAPYGNNLGGDGIAPGEIGIGDFMRRQFPGPAGGGLSGPPGGMDRGPDPRAAEWARNDERAAAQQPQGLLGMSRDRFIQQSYKKPWDQLTGQQQRWINLKHPGQG